MRITTGKAKGHKIKVPKIKEIRPAQEIVRSAVFSILGEKVKGAQVLDLYAGSGSFGLEALSRGAKRALFIDISPLSCKAIKDNLKHTRLEGRGEVTCQSAESFLYSTSKTYDLIFLDPPYSQGKIEHIFTKLKKRLSKEGIIVFTHARSLNLSEKFADFKVIDRRSFGATGITLLTHKNH